MVSKKSIEDQLLHLGFNVHSWVNRAEIRELPHVILPDEEIYECVNGYYEGGFALLVATNIRLLLIDKKPFNYLNVEDLRFDMINEIDYSHRMMGAQISISAGAKNLKFRSYNQPRLRKLIGHVQHCMAETKKRESDHQEGQNQHLERINQQLQTYLLAQYQSQLDFNQRLREAQAQGNNMPVPQEPMVKPSPELADYLYSQSLLRQHAEQQTPQGEQLPLAAPQQPEAAAEPQQPPAMPPSRAPLEADAQIADLYEEGRREVFGKANSAYNLSPAANSEPIAATPATEVDRQPARPMPQFQVNLPLRPAMGLEVNALRIAYSRLPMALRNRKFGRPSFHAHSRATSRVKPLLPTQPPAPA